jgi:flagellar biosynthetic protein FliR
MIVGQQAGLALASVFDPNTQTRSSVIGQIYFFAATAVFLLVGGHRVILEVLLGTFDTIPVMTFELQDASAYLLARLMMNALLFSVKLAAPMVIALLIAKAGLGFLSRSMPQLHILSVGFAIFVSIGMFLSGFELVNLHDLLMEHLGEALEVIEAILNLSSSS